MANFVFSDIDTIIEKEDGQDGTHSIIKLTDLSKLEEAEINPLVPPTSGLRMRIFEIENDTYTLTKEKLFHFLRFMKGISIIAKKELNNNAPSILIVTDDRPSGDILLKYASRIFSFENYKIYHQSGKGDKAENSSHIRGHSKMGTPHASVSVALFENIDIVLMLTASHNSIEWNGLKFYIKRPIPISGGVMKEISKIAITIDEIPLSNSYKPIYIDADKVNNDYILDLVSKITDLSVLKNKKIVVWPMLGNAPEILDLLNRCGAEIILIDEDTDPPDPTKPFNEKKIEDLMAEKGAKIAILLDADRDRLVFIINIDGVFFNLSPNELYTAMHNILAEKLKRTIINVRTIPSDPRCDRSAKINFITGVGYKHLGLIQYMAAKKEVPESQLKTGILYVLENNEFRQLKTYEDVEKVLLDSKIEGDLVFVLWEESGGHTFNILNGKIENGKYILESKFPLVGDKYPAPAILVLCSLLEMGYDLTEYIDPSQKGDRVTINADDEKKIKYMNYLSKKVGEHIDISGESYLIGEFSTVVGKITTIHLKSDKCDLYIRPSGTGPGIKVYVYGPEKDYKKEMLNVANYIENLTID